MFLIALYFLKNDGLLFSNTITLMNLVVTVFLLPFTVLLSFFFQANKFTKWGVCVALKWYLQGTTDKEKRMSFAYKRKLHNEQQMQVKIPWLVFIKGASGKMINKYDREMKKKVWQVFAEGNLQNCAFFLSGVVGLREEHTIETV